MTLVLDRDQLHESYVEDGLSLTQIGKLYELSPQTVGRLLRKHSIPVRGRGNPKGRKPQPKGPDLSREPATIRVLTLANFRGWLLDRLEHLDYPQPNRERYASLVSYLQHADNPKIGPLLNDWWAIHMLDPNGSQRSFRRSIESLLKGLENTVRNHKRQGLTKTCAACKETKILPTAERRQFWVKGTAKWVK